MSVLPQKQGPVKKSFFYVFNWNHIANERIFQKFWSKNHCWWQWNVHDFLYYVYYRSQTSSGAGSRENISFYVFDWNHIYNKAILFKIFKQMQCLCQCNIQVFLGYTSSGASSWGKNYFSFLVETSPGQALGAKILLRFWLKSNF